MKNVTQQISTCVSDDHRLSVWTDADIFRLAELTFDAENSTIFV